MKISNHQLKKGNPLFKIAEISANHNGSIDRAKKTIEAAKQSGADAVKFQTYTPDTITINCDRDEFILKGGTWDGAKLYDLYKSAHTPYEWHKELFDYAKELKITCFSSPFDKTAVELLESLNCPAYKIASFEIIDHPLIEEVAKTGKPILMSTGAASENEIQEALELARSFGAKDILLFHCISAYPALLEDSGLLAIEYLKNKYDVEVGLSDHTIGPQAGIIAASLGAVAIEKHFTLNRSDGGPDSSFSMEPKEFKEMSAQLDLTVKALGKNTLSRSQSEKQSRSIRKSIYFIKNLKSGNKITEKDIKVIRPGNGLHPKFLKEIIGSTVMADVSFGEATSLQNIKFNEKKINSKTNEDISFEEIIPNKEQIGILYDFLKKRKHFISHNITPSIKEHSIFVENNPYRYWFLIKYNMKIVGSVYIQDDNSVGINLEFNLIKFTFKEFIEKLKFIVAPKPEIKSKRYNDFFINVSPSDIELQNWLKQSEYDIHQISFTKKN